MTDPATLWIPAFAGNDEKGRGNDGDEARGMMVREYCSEDWFCERGCSSG